MDKNTLAYKFFHRNDKPDEPHVRDSLRESSDEEEGESSKAVPKKSGLEYGLEETSKEAFDQTQSAPISRKHSSSSKGIKTEQVSQLAQKGSTLEFDESYDVSDAETSVIQGALGTWKRSRESDDDATGSDYRGSQHLSSRGQPRRKRRKVE